MRGRLTKWAVTLAIVFGVPIVLVWIFMPILDLSHATYLAQQGDYKLALRALNRAISFNGGMASAYTRRGYIYAKLGDDAKALADFDRAVMLNDGDWEPYNNKAWVFTRIGGGDLKQAMQDVNEAISLCSNCAAPLDTRGVVQLKMDHPEEALQDFNRAIELNDRLGEAYYHRALSYELLNEPLKAKQDRTRAQQYGYYPDEQTLGSDLQPPKETVSAR